MGGVRENALHFFGLRQCGSWSRREIHLVIFENFLFGWNTYPKEDNPGSVPLLWFLEIGYIKLLPICNMKTDVILCNLQMNRNWLRFLNLGKRSHVQKKWQGYAAHYMMYKRRWILHGHHSRKLSAQKELINRKTVRKSTDKKSYSIDLSKIEIIIFCSSLHWLLNLDFRQVGKTYNYIISEIYFAKNCIRFQILYVEKCLFNLLKYLQDFSCDCY